MSNKKAMRVNKFDKITIKISESVAVERSPNPFVCMCVYTITKYVYNSRWIYSTKLD